MTDEDFAAMRRITDSATAKAKSAAISDSPLEEVLALALALRIASRTLITDDIRERFEHLGRIVDQVSRGA